MRNQSKKTQAITWGRTDGHCWYCGKKLRMGRNSKDKSQAADNSHDWFTVDHIIARSDGGTDDHGNLVPACRQCNCSKGTKTYEEYREYMSRVIAGAPFFNAEQITYLKANDIELPAIEQVTFYGEKV